MDRKSHDMMDDMGEHALSRRELYMPQGRPEQGWPLRSGSPEIAPAEACTELGAEPTTTRRRLGPISRIERALLRRPTNTVAAIFGLALAAAAVRTFWGAA